MCLWVIEHCSFFPVFPHSTKSFPRKKGQGIFHAYMSQRHYKQRKVPTTNNVRIQSFPHCLNCIISSFTICYQLRKTKEIKGSNAHPRDILVQHCHPIGLSTMLAIYNVCAMLMCQLALKCTCNFSITGCTSPKKQHCLGEVGRKAKCRIKNKKFYGLLAIIVYLTICNITFI